MKASFFKYLFGTAILIFAAYACVKKTSYPTVPEIEFKDLIPFVGDSADLQVKFTDGDGDIGAAEADSIKNFFYTYYYKDTVTQTFRAYYSSDIEDTLRTSYTIKSPDDSYKGKPISGEINIRLQQFRHIKQVKHVKYVFYLIDASGNKSNVVTSPEIVVQ